MRAALGIVSLLLVLATVGLLAKKQLVASPTRVPVVQPASDAPSAGAAAPTAPAATARAQSQQVQQQLKQTVEGLMQQARPMPDGE